MYNTSGSALLAIGAISALLAGLLAGADATVPDSAPSEHFLDAHDSHGNPVAPLVSSSATSAAMSSGIPIPGGGTTISSPAAPGEAPQAGIAIDQPIHGAPIGTTPRTEPAANGANDQSTALPAPPVPGTAGGNGAGGGAGNNNAQAANGANFNGSANNGGNGTTGQVGSAGVVSVTGNGLIGTGTGTGTGNGNNTTPNGVSPAPGAANNASALGLPSGVNLDNSGAGSGAINGNAQAQNGSAAGQPQTGVGGNPAPAAGTANHGTTH